MDVYEATSLSDKGYGVVIKDKQKFYVPNLLPGEKAEIRFFKSGYGKVERLIESSMKRIKPKCPRFSDCGGCMLQHIPYEKQLEMKTNLVRSKMHQSGFDESLCLPIIGMKEPFFYRNKVQMIISEKDRKIMSGLFEENTHKIVNIDKCVIQDDKANKIIKTCRDLMQLQKIKPYDEDKKTGLVRYIFVRTSNEAKQILVVIVTSEETFPGRNNFVKALREIHPEITSIVQNVNSRSTSVVLGDFERVLFGQGRIEDVLLGKKYTISPKTFYQVNHRQTEIMYKKALEFAKPKQEDIVLELYSGIGTIGILFAEYVKKVIGVELNKESVKNAIMNARINQAKNIKFYHEDAAEFLHDYVMQEYKADIVIVDPPREGLDRNVVDLIIKLKPEKICYLSCNPDSLMNDLAFFVKANYQIKRVQPVDMFPQTYHVESVSLLSLK